METNRFNIKYICIAVMAALLSACSSEDLVKDDIDAANAGDPSKLPTVTMAAPANVTYESVDVSAAWSGGGDEIIEAGFVYSLNESFLPIHKVVTIDEISSSNIEATMAGLDPETSYYVKAYARTRDNGVAYSSAISLTTLVAPSFEDTYLFGKYDAQDIDITTGEPEGDIYEITISQKGANFDRVDITNIWGGEMTVEGIVDFEKKTISIARTEVIYVHSSYGNTYMWGLVIEDGAVKAYAETAIATYDSEGNITFEPWAARVSAGVFGYYITVLEKK
ncbi:MAG: hypothetical protein LBG28_08500 [Tannerella sp.]|jgi:hypothetical protein|nr:hypothetical protein [Tannerella sp.]